MLGSLDLKDERKMLSEVLEKLWTLSMSRSLLLQVHTNDAQERSSKDTSMMREHQPKMTANSSMYACIAFSNPPPFWGSESGAA